MTPGVWGALLGAAVGGGLVLVVARLVALLRRPPLAVRVLPYVRDLPGRGTPQRGAQVRPAHPASERGVVSSLREVFGPSLQSAGRMVERVLGGSGSVRRRLERANLPGTVQDFRVEQVVWGLVGFSAAAAVALLVSWRSPGRVVPLLVLCAVAFAGGVLLRENRLTAQVAARERRILQEFPVVAEMLALAVAAGESPVAALDRVVARTHGELAVELSRVLADTRTGTPVTRALEMLAERTGLPVVARFAEGLAVAMERGTPLTDVLHAQAADVRESGRRALIEAGARKEIAMMVPVVFLVLPVTVVFAFWPGVVGLRLVTP